MLLLFSIIPIFYPPLCHQIQSLIFQIPVLTFLLLSEKVSVSVLTLYSFVSYNNLSSSSNSFIVSLDSISLPTMIHKTLSHFSWRTAMEEEMTALKDNGTWALVHLPEGKKAIGCNWVFAIKVNPDCSVAYLKAHLVAKGYAQAYGIDYFDTSPVAKMAFVRLFISMATTYNWPSHRLDIKNVFFTW